MKSLTHYTLIVSTAAFLSGCGNSQLPLAQAGVNAQINRAASLPAKSHDLLYVALGGGHVEILSYPAVAKVGSIYYGLYSYLQAECSDPSGHVWITDYSGISEYRHGGTKPIIQDFTEWDLTGCSVAPQSDDLAAVGQSTIFVWSHGVGKAKQYRTKSKYTLRHCGYDADGNLFVDGFDPANNNKFILFELPSGGRTLARVALDQKIGGAGQVQWDGRYLAIQDSDAPYDIYQVSISGGMGSVVNTIAFDGLRGRVEASWIAGSTVFVPYSVRGDFPNGIGVFNYPAGGQPISILEGKQYKYVSAVTLSR
jgi:hypothetical protein